MESLVNVITDPSQRSAVISDAVSLIDEQVSNERGASGFAIKAGYKVVSKLRSGKMIPRAVDALLDDFAEAIDPLHQKQRHNAPEQSFGSYLETHRKEAAQALLSITDRRIERASSVVANTYAKLRPMAEKRVAKAAPDIGQLVERHTSYI